MKGQLIFRTLLMVVVAVVAFSVSSMAQNSKQVENVKIAIFTKVLDLNEKQAQQFWPVYNKYEKQLKNLHEELKQDGVNAEEMMDIEDQTVKVKKKRINDLRSIITKEQLNKLPKAEREFRGELLKILRN